MAKTPLEAALEYAALGMAVFPVHWPIRQGDSIRCSCGKSDCHHPGKHPRTKRGFKDASNDSVQIEEWWTACPDANIGLVTGEATGVVVLDVDPRNGGNESLAKLIREHGGLPATIHAKTGGGGDHYYFKYPGMPIKCRELADGLDCKADGGYIIASPSRHASGGTYEWTPGNAPSERQAAALPIWLLKLLTTDRPGKKSSSKPKKQGRNNRLTSLGGKLRRAGQSEDEIAAALAKHNTEEFDEPLSDAEVQGIARSVAKYPAGNQQLYEMRPDGIIYHKPTKDGPTEVRLTNFQAQIVADIEEDDGLERTRQLEVIASIGNRVRRFFIAADAFQQMKWPIRELGSGAIVYPGYSGEAHARTAIQAHSRDAAQRTVYAHTGWREMDGNWYFMHAGGAVSQHGVAEHVSTKLGALDKVILPPPATGDELITALKAVFNLIRLGPPRILYPLLAGTFRAPLGKSDFSLFLFGHTGTYKSETAALCQRFFGSGLNARNLPASWSSTANAIEETCFRLKDTLVVIDDFKPSGDSSSDNRLHQMADRILRGQGNGSGRGRLDANLQPRAPRPSRALILGTGEDVPRGQSLRGRLVILELSPGEILPQDLTICQQDGDAGLYAKVMAAYCQWLATDYRSLIERFNGRALELRSEFTGSHSRQPTSLAHLHAGFEMFISFVSEVTGETVLSAQHADEHVQACQTSLEQIGAAQASFQAAQDPVSRYIELLRSALSSGRAHVTDIAGGEPENARAWGWRPEAYGSTTQLRALGDRIGWVDGEDLYLEPDAAYRIANQIAPDGENIPVNEKTLRKRLDERKLLKSAEKDRNSLTVRRTLSGCRIAVLHLRASVLAVRGGELEEGT